MQQEIYTGIPDELTKHNFAKIMQISHINPDMEYADDVSKVSSNYNDIKKFKDEAPKVLLSRRLQVDNTKTEVYVIKENNNWDKCKLLGSLLDFIEDIK